MSSSQTYELHEYQEVAADCLYEKDQTIWVADLGAGKTLTSLVAFQDLRDQTHLRRAIIWAPQRVAQTVWEAEARKFGLIPDARIVTLAGLVADERAKALAGGWDVLVVNYELAPWLDAQGVRADSDVIVIFDEVSKLKTATGKRRKKVMKVSAGAGARWGLTATPKGNGALDLWGQADAVAPGAWGTFYSWRARHFRSVDRNGFMWKVLPGCDELINEQFTRLAFSVDVPKFSEPVPLFDEVILPPDVLAMYKDFEREFVLEVGDGDDIFADSAMAAAMKCRQISAGFVYDDLGEAQWMHDAKIDALEEICERSGENVLALYAFREEVEAVKRRFGDDVPVLGDGTTSKESKRIIDAWNAGEIPLLLGSPQCLHPSTEVLTEDRGWVPIVEATGRVHDGVEFVSHGGCSFSGVKEVITRLGVTMTPDHRLLIDGEWTEVQNVRDTEEVREAALFRGQVPAVVCREVRGLRRDARHGNKPHPESEQGAAGALRSLSVRGRPRHVRGAPVWDLERYDATHDKPEQTVLRAIWGRWAQRVGRVAEVRKFLARYGADVLRWFDFGPDRQLAGVQQGELSLGHERAAAGEQGQFAFFGVSRAGDALGRVLSRRRGEQGRHSPIPEPGVVGGRSGGSVEGLDVSEEPQVAPVFDLVDCGPRNRFLIRNAAGDVFISHNSMSHGINLQSGGRRIVWLSLTWSLEDYQQANGRLARQGQKETVYVHHLSAAGTIDTRVAGVLRNKAVTQSALLDAIKANTNGQTEGLDRARASREPAL